MKGLLLTVAFVLMLGSVARAGDKDGTLYAYALYDDRYADIFTAIDAYKPIGPSTSAFRPFVGFTLSRDLGTGGDVPLILNDNYAVGALGFQYTNNSGFRAFIQGGLSAQAGPASGIPSGGDLRAGVQLYREWGGAPLYDKTQNYGNFYGSATYYSRYQDTILYNQLESGRNVGSGATPLELYIRTAVTLDTHGNYYSNLAEATAGARLHIFGKKGPTLSIEQILGTYVGNFERPAGTARGYTDFRPTLSYGVNI